MRNQVPLFYRNEIIQVLHDIFGKLTEELLSDIERSLTWERVGRGDALFHRREIGLVLSGGGARGFAHAGFLRAMREAGLPVDPENPSSC